MTIERVQLTGDRAAWLKARLLYNNASEMATIVGEGGFGSLAELFAEKKGLRPPKVDNGVLKRGRWGEAAVFEAITDELPHWTVQRAKVHVIDHDNRIAATPDGFAEMPDRDGLGVVQAKVVASPIFRDYWLDDRNDSIEFGAATVPVTYRIQTVTERMLCADRCPWAVVAVIINGLHDWSFRLFDIEPDPVLEEKIVAKSREFFERYLDPNVMPEYEPQRDAELIRHLYPHDDGSEIDLSGDNRALAATEEWLETSAACTRMDKQCKALRTELAGKIGPHTYARLADGRRLSYKVQHRKAHAVEASDFRVLRIQKSGGAQ